MTLPRGNTELSRDERPIETIDFGPDNEDALFFKVGEQKITEIIAYDESGHMSNIPWIAVLKGEHIHLRTPADKVAVTYFG